MSDHAQVLREHRYHALRVISVVDETPDTRSFVLEVPSDLSDLFTYAAGQFCTLRATIGGEEVLRCYSMSSAPAVDAALTVTTKRVPGGVMSNWLNDEVRVGDAIELMRPSGVFCVRSGITPVFSIIKQILATTERSVHLLYANRDANSVIFHAEFEQLQVEFGDRLTVRHHLDQASGFLTAGDIASFASNGGVAADFYICGPTPFMDVVEAGLAEAGVDPAHISIERFANATVVPFAADAPAVDGDTTQSLTILLKKKRHTFDYVPGDTVLDAARRGGLKPPFSCELGNCASCMALLHEGSATMRANNALSADEVAEGWVLTCQAIPTGPSVVVEYESM
jgi:3-ketosteroid 9alpha-monooxygenase subunit B